MTLPDLTPAQRTELELLARGKQDKSRTMRDLKQPETPYPPPALTPGMPPHMPPGPRILRIKVETQHGDEYNANIPVSLAPHLDRLIPPHGRSALESAGFTLDALRLLIEASPYPGPLIDAQDQHGNEVHISLQ
ncbi:hypothetical protein DEGR_31390 [Deinococcus grandis]|nr:hypothetical protein DEGR_31390 [Deinococcus grandis]